MYYSVTRCRLAQNDIVFRSGGKRVKMGMKFLEENLLDHLQRPEFANLQSSLIKRTYPKGAYISQPGNGENSIFIVIDGRIRVYLGYEDKEFNLGILTQGDIYSTPSGT